MKQPPKPKKERKKKVAGTELCRVCGAPFFYEAYRIPSTCGLLYCRAMDEWGDDEWEGQARMAQARPTGVVRTVHGLKVIRDGQAWLCDCSMEEMHTRHGDADVIRDTKEIVIELSPLDKEALRRFPNAGL